MPIILVWMRWSWKSFIWKMLADRLNLELIDTDKLIEDTYKNSIKNIVESVWWDEFRIAEESVLWKITSKNNKVIATWWWLPFYWDNKTKLKQIWKIIWLKVSPDLVKNRLLWNIEIRPAISWDNVLDEINILCKQREDWYSEIADIIVDIDKLADWEKIVDFVISNLELS